MARRLPFRTNAVGTVLVVAVLVAGGTALVTNVANDRDARAAACERVGELLDRAARDASGAHSIAEGRAWVADECPSGQYPGPAAYAFAKVEGLDVAEPPSAFENTQRRNAFGSGSD